MEPWIGSRIYGLPANEPLDAVDPRPQGVEGNLRAHLLHGRGSSVGPHYIAMLLQTGNGIGMPDQLAFADHPEIDDAFEFAELLCSRPACISAHHEVHGRVERNCLLKHPVVNAKIVVVTFESD